MALEGYPLIPMFTFPHEAGFSTRNLATAAAAATTSQVFTVRWLLGGFDLTRLV